MRLRTRRLLVAASLMSVAVLVPSAIGFAATARAHTLPVGLVGRWTRTISKADIQRTGGSGFTPGTVCTLTIKKNGAAHLHTTTQGDFDGSLVPTGPGRVHILLGLSYPDVYSWHVAGTVLTFTKVTDAVGDRVAAMEGAWKRK